VTSPRNDPAGIDSNQFTKVSAGPPPWGSSVIQLLPGPIASIGIFNKPDAGQLYDGYSQRSFISPSFHVSGSTPCHAADEISAESATQRVPSS
jgi:hypothetical protein